jgi:hypothetical protein
MLTIAPPTGPLAAGPATLPQGWLALPGHRLGGAAIPLVLLHPRHGVVLAGGPADGPALLRQRLAAGRFPAIFQGHLPIARTDQPPADPAAALAGEAPLSLPGGEAWVLAVCRALENEAPVGPPQRLGFRARRRRSRRRMALALGGTTALVLLLGLGLASLPPTPLSAPAVPPLAEIGAPPGDADAGQPLPALAEAAIAPPVLPPFPVVPAAVPPPPGPLALAPAPPANAGPPLPGAPAGPPALTPPPRPEGPTAPATLAMPEPRPAPHPVPLRPAPAETVFVRAGTFGTQPVGPATRCRLITQRMQIGETVPDADIQFLRLGCPG